MEACLLSCTHLKNTAIFLVARTFRRLKLDIYRQILPSVGWNLYLFEHKFALLTGSLLSHALWREYAYLGSLQGKSLAHPTVVLSCCRIQHVSHEGKHGSLACKCWKCILWSALGLVTGERAAGQRECTFVLKRT